MKFTNCFRTKWNFFKKIWPLLSNSFMWTFYTFAFGLLQIWFIWLICFLLDKKPLIEELINGCSLLFFSTGIIASVAFDAIFSNKKMSVFIHIFFPIIVVSFCSITYTCFYLGEIIPNFPSIKIEKAFDIQSTLLFISMIYAIVCKTRQNYYSENVQKSGMTFA